MALDLNPPFLKFYFGIRLCTTIVFFMQVRIMRSGKGTSEPFLPRRIRDKDLIRPYRRSLDIDLQILEYRPIFRQAQRRNAALARLPGSVFSATGVILRAKTLFPSSICLCLADAVLAASNLICSYDCILHDLWLSSPRPALWGGNSCLSRGGVGNGLVVLFHFFAVLADSLNALAVGAPFVPGFLMCSTGLPSAFSRLMRSCLRSMLVIKPWFHLKPPQRRKYRLLG